VIPRGKAPRKGKGPIKRKTPLTHYLVVGLAVLVLVVAVLALFVLPRYLAHTVQDVPGHNNLQALAVFYGRYISQHRGKSPSNIEELKTWLKKQDSEQFESMNVDPNNLDALFTSPRDNQPFGFVFTASAMNPGPDGKGSVVIYEQKGVGGRRLVAYTTTQIEEVDEATFKRLVPGT
jgi:Tfp pilus assembly protein PilE